MSDSYVNAVQAECARLASERARIDGLLAGLELALRLYNAPKAAHAPASSHFSRSSDRAPSTAEQGASRAQDGTIKDYVFELIGAFQDGLASGEVLAEAERQGRPLNKNTVTSLLSAHASKGLLELVNGRYRIPQGIPAAPNAAGDVNPEPSVEAEEAARKVGGT